METENKFGHTLKMLRLRKGMTQTELSKASGVYQAQISTYEKGTCSPSPQIAKKLLAILGAPEIYYEYYEKPVNADCPALAGNIRYLRTRSGLTQTALAKVIGVTQARLSGYENGGYMPSPLRLKKLAAFFDIDMEQLLQTSLSSPAVSPADYDYDWEAAERIQEESCYMPSKPLSDSYNEKFCQLTEEDQQKVMEFIDFLLSKQ